MIEPYRLLLLGAHRVPGLIRGYYDQQGGLSGMEPLADYLRAALDAGELALDDVPVATEQFVHLVPGGIRTRMPPGAARRP
uniref:TetR/AcrR family transcriptional regulator C-terminal domain-containing protein n=1 Tax=Burkholderia ubonensis TaxID=101571 RepID=UPI00016A2905